MQATMPIDVDRQYRKRRPDTRQPHDIDDGQSQRQAAAMLAHCRNRRRRRPMTANRSA